MKNKQKAILLSLMMAFMPFTNLSINATPEDVHNTSYVQFPDTNNNYANLTFNNALMTLSVSLE